MFETLRVSMFFVWDCQKGYAFLGPCPKNSECLGFVNVFRIFAFLDSTLKHHHSHRLVVGCSCSLLVSPLSPPPEHHHDVVVVSTTTTTTTTTSPSKRARRKEMVDTYTTASSSLCTKEESIEILSRQRDANLGRAVRQERRHRRHAVASPARRRGRIERAFNRRRRQNEENSRRDGKSGRVCHRSLFHAESVQKARTGR